MAEVFSNIYFFKAEISSKICKTAQNMLNMLNMWRSHIADNRHKSDKLRIALKVECNKDDNSDYYMTNSYRPGLKKFDWFKAGL